MVNNVDPVDLYRITTARGGYLFDGKRLPFERSRHELNIRQPDGNFETETLEITSTIHGPVIKTQDGAPIAMRVAAL